MTLAFVNASLLDSGHYRCRTSVEDPDSGRSQFKRMTIAVGEWRVTRLRQGETQEFRNNRLPAIVDRAEAVTTASR